MHNPTTRLPRTNRPILAALGSALLTLVAPAWAQVIHEDLKLAAFDGMLGDGFGYSIAIDGSVVAVGARFDDDHGTRSGSAYLFDALTGAQTAKLLASDGDGGDQFGHSIAIDNDVVAVGAAESDTVGDRNGSAYLFDSSSGREIAKLLPSDPGPLDRFGSSIAIDNGVVAVGAPYHNGPDPGSGAAYLFDAFTGAQIAKLLPSDGAAMDLFGISIAIDGGVVAIGAHLDDDNGDKSGSAYLFDATTGAQLFKLLPSDGAANDRFGRSLAITAGVVAVGAYNDDNSGSVYLFDVSTGAQIFKLLPSDGAANDRFGYSIAIDDSYVAVGAFQDDDNGIDSGSAYLFDALTGTQIVKLTPSDGAANDWFAASIAITNAGVAVGAHRGNDLDSFSGSAYVFRIDSDGDSLFDDWEINGIPYTDSQGVEQRFVLPGADPIHKDLYIEIDAMQGLAPTQAALDLVVQAFADAPHDLVNNPDKLDGITVHLEGGGVDEDNLPLNRWPDAWTEFDALKVSHFGTVAEQADPEWAGIREAKARAYRYCIFADSFDGDGDGTFDAWSGMGELPGNDFMVTLGHPKWQTFFQTSFGSQHKDRAMAGTFMHELGHTLGMRHGGGDHRGYKPNYHSVMNYLWQVPKPGYAASWELDYSRQAFPSLDEWSLDEPAGIYGHIGHMTAAGPAPRQIVPEDGPVDWNRNGILTDTGVIADINASGSLEVLDGFEDWSQMVFDRNVNWEPGIHLILLGTEADLVEMTWEMYDSMFDGCPADVNGDGIANTQDFIAFLDAWANSDPLADWDENGLIDTRDFVAYLNDWAAGCP